MNQPYIDLILLCYGKFPTTTKRCLDSLLTDCTAQNTKFRLTVVDNASPDNSAQLLEEYLESYPHIRVQRLEKNLGFAGGMNYGASMATGEWILLVSNDTIFAQGSLESLYQALSSQPAEVGMVGPVTNNAGNEQCYKISGNVDEVIAKAKFFQHYPTGMLISCYRLDFFCVAIRRSLWQELHGLDPVYGAGYYEDTDFSLRAKSTGARLLVCEDAFVYHVGGATLSVDPRTRALIKRNKRILLSRHPEAKLEHQRENNLAVLQEYLTLRKKALWNEGLEARAQRRIAALRSDLPRSPIKKWLWQRKVSKLLKQFAELVNENASD